MSTSDRAQAGEASLSDIEQLKRDFSNLANVVMDLNDRLPRPQVAMPAQAPLPTAAASTAAEAIQQASDYGEAVSMASTIAGGARLDVCRLSAAQAAHTLKHLRPAVLHVLQHPQSLPESIKADLFRAVVGAAVRIGAVASTNSVAICPAQERADPLTVAQYLSVYAAKVMPLSRSTPVEAGEFYMRHIQADEDIGQAASKAVGLGEARKQPDPRRQWEAPPEGFGGHKRPRSWVPQDNQQQQAPFLGHQASGQSQSPSGAGSFPFPRRM
jgi:hypothetical protein